MTRCVVCKSPVPANRKKLCSSSCSRESQRRRCKERYHRLSDEYKDTTRRWQENNPKKYLINQARHSAKARGLECSLQEKDIEIPSTCPILGLPLEKVGSKPGLIRDLRPSLDRIDSTKGYVSGNVQVVSWRANRLKSNASLKELARIGAWAENILCLPPYNFSAGALQRDVPSNRLIPSRR